MSEICVLGTGMAGYGAAHKLREAGAKGILFDKKPHYGGHTASFEFEGKFTFDEGPHVSFTKHERLQKLFAESIDNKYEVLHTKVNNYWKGHWVKHPAQVNLHGLPTDLVVNVIKDFVAAQQKQHGEIVNYEQWLRASFGDTFAENFPMQYTIKYHTTEAKNKSLDWIGPRLYQAKLEEVLRGALQPASVDVHYISGFRYPSHGGFVAYLKRFMESSEVRLGHKLASIDPKKKEVGFANGNKVPYKGIVSSVPLPDLIPTIRGTPKEVLEAAAKLACSEVVIVNLVINRADLLDAHWTYIYDQDIFFTRLSTPHLQSPHNVPPGCGSIQAECYYSKKYRPLDRTPKDCIEPTIRDLKKIGVLREEDQILFKDVMHIEYANVIFDLERAAALKIVHGYLDELGIAYCGRYGDWAYIWTDESFISGENAAEKVLKKVLLQNRIGGTRFMAKLETTTGYKDGKALMREMAKSLKGTPYDTSKPIPFSFYLYVSDRKTAANCAKVLKSNGCEIEVEKSAANDGRWLCLCHATLTLLDGTVTKLGDRLVQLAKEHGGEFDGWEVNPYKNPGALADLMALLAEFQNKKATKAKKTKKVLKKI